MALSRIFRPYLLPLTGASLLALCSAVAHADDCVSPVQLDDKPAMSSYGDYEDFLVAAMEHKAKEEEKNKHQKMCPQLYQKVPVIVDQAETLDDAVRRSAEQQPFDYSSNQSWYDRSTSQSFGLSGLPNSSMAGETIHTSLSGLEDSPLADDLRNILLALQGPLDGIDNGGNASSVNGQMLSDVLIIREREVLAAFGYDSFFTRLKGVSFSEDGNMVLFLGSDDFLYSESNILIESCLSSCGEFSLTINMR